MYLRVGLGATMGGVPTCRGTWRGCGLWRSVMHCGSYSSCLYVETSYWGTLLGTCGTHVHSEKHTHTDEYTPASTQTKTFGQTHACTHEHTHVHVNLHIHNRVASTHTHNDRHTNTFSNSVMKSIEAFSMKQDWHHVTFKLVACIHLFRYYMFLSNIILTVEVGSLHTP